MPLTGETFEREHPSSACTRKQHLARARMTRHLPDAPAIEARPKIHITRARRRQEGHYIPGVQPGSPAGKLQSPALKPHRALQLPGTSEIAFQLHHDLRAAT